MLNHIVFVLCLLVGGGIYFPPLNALTALTLASELYSHMSLIPAVSLFLLWQKREAIFGETRRAILPGAAIAAAGLAAYALATVFRGQLDTAALQDAEMSNDYLTLCMAGFVAWVIGSFIAVYGLKAFQKARFPLLFLAFIIPIPMFLMNAVMQVLQHASAEAADIVFKLSGAPYHRNGVVFEFPNVTVEVAKQCSGIRSSLALIILSIITGHLFLSTVSRRLILVLSIFPITVVKNAFRIVTVTLLANYVDMRFISNHWIHSSGGIPFFAVAMAMFIPLVWVLRRTEGPGARHAAQGAGPAAAEEKDLPGPAPRK